MRFLCDVHISFQLVKCIQKLGFECKQVNTLPNKWNTSDAEICDYVDANDYILIRKIMILRTLILSNKRLKSSFASRLVIYPTNS
jgi:hypothetical protein